MSRVSGSCKPVETRDKIVSRDKLKAVLSTLIRHGGARSGLSDLHTIYDDAELAEEIRQRLDTDRYLTTMSKPLGVSIHRLIACCRRHGIRYPNRHATDREISDAIHHVTIKGLSIREAAAVTGISPSAVQRYVAQRRSVYVSGNFRFLPISVPVYRCPRHGLMRVSPCIACEALAQSKRRH